MSAPFLTREDREITYKIFAKLFYYPDEEIAGLLFDGVISALINSLPIHVSDAETVMDWIKSFSTEEEFLEAIQVEYTNLFITNFPKLPAPLYKSYYSEKELFGKDTERLIEIYQKYNFKVSSEISELPDHLAIQLEFVYRLIEQGTEILAQKNFVKNEILGWIDELQSKINESSSIPIYSFMIKVIIKFIKYDVSIQDAILTGAEL
ncbi:hypothetical protein MNBD_IGNAVI01-1327 [hydrothermal vent metagenome]|uniref:Formate dehydrogenase-specific chaperone n=1 Tax=hydrothermal vent metagenome TaxID=652676 RepID=A0A3B1CEN3_9ZZZZ